MVSFHFPESEFYALQLPTILVLALVSGPLGCLLFWRRLPFMVDVQSHGMLLGAVLAMIFSVHPSIGAFFIGVFFVFFALWQENRLRIYATAANAVSSIFFLTLGILIYSFVPHPEGDLEELLFGELDSITSFTLVSLTLAAVLVFCVCSLLWQAFMLSLVHEDIAQIEGISPKKLKTILSLCVTLIVAIGLPLAGVLPMGALMLLPALFISQNTSSVRSTVVGSTVYALGLSAVGAFGAASFNVPLGPSIALALSLPFVCLIFVMGWRRRAA